MAMRRRIKKIVGWFLVLVLAILGGGLTFAYYYVTDSATLASFLRRELPRFLPAARFEVVRVAVRPLMGDFELKHVALWKSVDGRQVRLLHIPYLKISQDVSSLLRGEFHPSEVAVGQPTLRLARRADGSWNFQGLLADPWPYPPPVRAPLIRIEKGTLELDQGDEAPLVVLRDVSVRLEAGDGPYAMNLRGSAQGVGILDHLKFEGTYNLKTGRLEITKGDLARVGVAAALRSLPADYAACLQKSRLIAGEVGISSFHAVLDPAADRPLTYGAVLDLHDGATVGAPELPFALENITAQAELDDGALTIVRARGTNGKTIVLASGTLPPDPAVDPLDLTIKVDDLEVDERLRDWTPPHLASIWPEFSPSGRVDVVTKVVREAPGGPPVVVTDVICRDVAMEFHEFRYPVEHLWGKLHIEETRIDIDLGTSSIGNRPASCTGVIRRPGRDPHVILDFSADALPVDETLLKAMPGDVKEVIDHFHPRGTVRGTLRLERTPETAEDPRGKVAITAEIEMDEQGHCSIAWDDLPYPITNLTGRLKIRPDHWIFEEMHGWNGVAQITGSGRVDQRRDGLKVLLDLAAHGLPFDQQLRQALPRNWRTTWDILNPVGACDVAAHIDLEPGRADHHHLELHPYPDTRVQLRFTPIAAKEAGQPGEPAPRVLELPPMERVGGVFIFDNGIVSMTDVRFWFRGAAVQFPSGLVKLEEDNRFDLRVKQLKVSEFRLDSALRQLMPPVMADFAQRLDEGRTYTLKTDLGLGWSGKPGEPTWCGWENGKVIFNGNAIDAGLPLSHIQGEINNLAGRFDGFELGVKGRLDLNSLNILGQQISFLKGDLDVGRGRARLTELDGTLLGGKLNGWVAVDLDTTPKYATALAIDGVDLRKFTATVPGKQNVRGQVSGTVALEGVGNDLKTLQGNGSVKITDAELGALPPALQIFKLLQARNALKLTRPTKTAFDAADVSFRIQEGRAQLDPIRFTGDAFSLHGSGHVDLTGDLDLRLKPLYGRDRFHLGMVSDAMREASGQVFDIHVTGPATMPRFSLEALPQAADAGKRLLSRPAEDPARFR